MAVLVSGGPPEAVLVRAARGIEGAVELLCKGLLLVSGLAMLVLLTVVVVMRYVFESGLASAPDLTDLLFAIFVMAGIVQAARFGAHVATQLTLGALKPPGRLALAVFIHALTAATYLVLGWYAFQNAIIAHDQRSPVLNIPWSVGYGVLAIGLALVGLCSLAAIVRHTLGGEPVAVGHGEGAGAL